MKSSKKRVSSKDVAKLAGVSQSTVSRVFSDKAKLISLETRNRVIKASDELGYRPSIIASSLSKNKTKIIGIEINDFSNAYYMKALGIFSRAFQAEGYELMIIPVDKKTNGDGLNMEDRLKSALEYQVAGLILTNAVMDDEYLNWCDKYQTPIFMFNRISSENHRFNSVIGDNYQGGYEIGQLMIKNNYSNVAYIAGDSNAFTNRKREEGFKESLLTSDIDCFTIEGTFDYDSGYRAAIEVIKNNKTIEAVFCGSDSIALGFIDGIHHESDLRIPEDIAVVGFDGIDEGENINYRLTTYKQPLEKIVEETVRALLNMIESDEITPFQLTIPGEIILRDTMK